MNIHTMIYSPVARRAGAIGLTLLAQGALAAPFDFDAAPGRLPKDVVPKDYTVDITPDLKTMSIAGRESVLLEVRKPVTSLTFNSLNERLTDVRLDGKPVGKVVSDDEKQLTVVTLLAPASPGPHTLSFRYTGKIEKVAQGLFAQAYRAADGKQATLLSTQMEATDARRMFPCWDEPSFRATFTLTATVPSSWTAVSNMPVAKAVQKGGLTTTTFERSPKMPSYLIEYTAGDIAAIAGIGDGTPLKVYAVSGREKDGATALANAAVILGDYNDYFGYRFPLPKLDSIAVPGGFQGAMENWGAITYNDQALLLNNASTSGAKQVVFSIEAHEMAHQWFGDLVTMGWWDEIWLNESFASWMAAKETAQRNPDWKWWEREDASKEQAMSADARVTSHPIEQHVTDELQASNAFDPEITYNKGQAVLRMFESYLGPDVFRSGVRSYMKTRAFSNATATDLWNSLGAASGRDVAAIAASWTTQPGFPLVTVTSSCAADGGRTVTLKQERFLIAKDATRSGRWSVPLSIRSGDAAPASVLLTSDGQQVAAGRCGTPLSINADAIGYFRVLYDEKTLASNTQAFGQLPDGDKIALLDDQWALVHAERQPLKAYLALASAMGDNTDLRAWEQITESLETIEHAMRTSPKHDAYRAYARAVLAKPFARLGFDGKPGDSTDVARLRRTLIADLGAWGDPTVVEESRRRFALFLKDHSAIAPDYQGAILGVVGENADPATFAALHGLAKGAKDQAELQRYYQALLRVRDPKLAEEASRIAMSSEIPPEAESVRIALVAELVDAHPQLSWKTFTTNVDQLTGASNPSFAPILIAQAVPQVYGTEIPLDEIQAFVHSKVPAEMNAEMERGVEAAKLKIAHYAILRREAEAML